MRAWPHAGCLARSPRRQSPVPPQCADGGPERQVSLLPHDARYRIHDHHHLIPALPSAAPGEEVPADPLVRFSGPFIAFLGGLDPQPLIAALGIDATDPVLRREEKLRSDLGRADLIRRDGTIPRALIEIKVAATEHRDQFSRYQNWAAGQNPPVAYFLVGLDGARKDVPETWVSKVTLPVLFRSWCNSTGCHVAWLASLTADLFEQWSNEVDGIIGHATSRVSRT
jgi:hypothetical protein